MADHAYEQTRAEILKLGPRTRDLALSNRKLAALPPEIARLPALQSLFLEGNQLTALPPEITRLTALRSLFLDGNQLTALPPEITRLTALQTLSLANNQLTALPPEIAHLTALKRLSLANNRLTALPPEIARLTALQRLSLARNQLTALPPELGDLTSLEQAAVDGTKSYAVGLYLQGNPLPVPYPALMEPSQPDSTRNVLAYLRGALPDKPAESQADLTPATPSIPRSRPATIRTAIVDGRITLDRTPSPIVLGDQSMRVALAALRTSLQDLLDDAASDLSNFDRRPLAQLRRSAERLPAVPLSTDALFELGHLHDRLRQYAPMVREQWPDALIVPFAVVLDHLNQVLAYCPEWQAYKAGPGQEALSPEQAQAAPEIAQSLAMDLRARDAREAVDDAIPEALDQFQGLQAALDDAAIDLLAPDILESVNNILKRIATLAALANPIDGKTLTAAAAAFGRRARKRAVKLTGELGDKAPDVAIKWARRFLYAGGASTAGSYTAAKLAAAYPHIFGWLGPIVTILPRLL